MTVPQSVATILKEHVTLEVEGIDRMYLNVYVPKLQRDKGVGMPSGRYDLRRLRLHGLIERLLHSHRYRLTNEGLRTTLFFTRTYARILRPGVARILPGASGDDRLLRPAFDKLDTAINQWVDQAKLSA